MGGGGHIIIKKKAQEMLALSTVLERLGASRRARADALVAADVSEWSHDDLHFALRCAGIAHETFE